MYLNYSKTIGRTLDCTNNYHRNLLVPRTILYTSIMYYECHKKKACRLYVLLSDTKKRIPQEKYTIHAIMFIHIIQLEVHTAYGTELGCYMVQQACKENSS